MDADVIFLLRTSCIHICIILIIVIIAILVPVCHHSDVTHEVDDQSVWLRGETQLLEHVGLWRNSSTKMCLIFYLRSL